jgi:uncharacterized repeat protein (TIGR01451 family)
LNVVARVLLSVMLVALTCFSGAARAQAVNQYSNTTAGAITDNNCATAGQITRTFVVGSSYIVGDVDIGILLSHSYRSDLRLTLTSPAGTSVTVMTWAGNVQSGDNMNDRFDDEAAAAIAAHNATVVDPLTPAPPPYSHSFQPSNPLSAFDGQNAQGTWTMVLCDAVAADTGTFTRADLFITSTSITITKTSEIVSDGVNASNWKAIPGATVRYCVLVSNNGGAVHYNVIMTDALPSNASFVPGSMLSGASCATAMTAEDDDSVGADESPVGMSITGSTVSGTVTSITSGTAAAFVFLATIN